MSKILDNTTGAPLAISDVGQTIDNVTNYTIPATDYLLWASSDDIITHIGNGNIVVNDGSSDLGISDATDLIKGLHPSTVNANITNTIPVDFVDSKNGYDSFGRLRTSDINNIFESTHVNSEQTEFWDYRTVGGGTKTYNNNNARIELGVGTASGDESLRQTLNYFHYAAGQSMLLRFTGVLTSGKTNLTTCCGYYNDDNGLIFRTKDGVFQVGIRTNTSGSVTETWVSQSAFNGDRLDGTGNSTTNKSGHLLDLDQTQIFEINFQWLGVGSVSFYMHINGVGILLHTFHNANVNNNVYMRTPHLPIRYEIMNTGVTASASTMHQICTQVANEGKSIVGDLINSVDNDRSSKSIVTSEFRPVISMRVKSTEDAILKITSVASLVKTSDDVLVHIYFDATLTGASWVSDSQFVEKDVSATDISGGTKILSYYISKQGRSEMSGFTSKFRLGEYIDGTKQTITVAMKSISSSASVLSSIAFKELF